MKVHFNAQGKGLYLADNAECGQTAEYHRSDGRVVHGSARCMTTDPAEVTCKRCKKTKAWKEAIK